MAHKPAALAEGSTDEIDSFCALFEKEQRRVAVMARLQRYLFSFEHAQAWLMFHSSGKSPPCDLKVKLYLLFTVVFKGESCKK